MTAARNPRGGPLEALRALALGYPEAREGVACKGTSLEKRTVGVRGKAFLFLGAADAMVKLRASLPEANRLAAKDPGRCRAGATGWVTVAVREGDPGTPGLLARWTDESYRLLAPRKLVDTLPGGSPPGGGAEGRASREKRGGARRSPRR
jgi:hypothetical protein